MKKIISFNPFILATGILLGFVFNPLNPYVSYLKVNNFVPFLRLISSIIIFLWYVGLAHFSYVETNKKHFSLFIVSLVFISLDFLLDLLEISTGVSTGEILGLYFNLYGLKSFLFSFVVINLSMYLSLILLIRKYLYARSLWVIFLELSIPFLGVISLNSSLLNEKKELETIEQDLNQFGK